ncbi:hypothetical protein HPB52_007748 [Rhipicephalus sanguineus]|uniref:GOLD domain-containing protein n=1 Tax=Rhipicephalus sanguineus TaxID=34632 RepID=A0A9D4SU33_RHISA|nr:hypothetical protein HPB52_007748 [Rhipicephalus sanguineus]
MSAVEDDAAAVADRLTAKEQAALDQHIAWRKKNEVDSILEDYQPPKVLLEYFPGGFVDCSTDGRPVLIVPVGQADFKVVSALTDVVRMYEDNFPEILEQAYLVNGGWQELLTSRMNVQRLPVQWGGKLTGPDGDERCRNLATHVSNKRGLRTQICPGGTIPDKYRRKRSEAAGAESHTVGAGSSWTLPVSVARAGSELRWDFCTSSGDLKFAVRFRPNDGGAGDVDESRDLVPRTMVPCSRREPHSGSVHCHEPGTYELVFDNSYSWLTRKEVSSSVKLLPPPTRSET